MIRKIFASLFVFSVVLILGFQTALAQTSTEEGAVAGQTQKEKIEDLKERIATKVAQMRVQTYKAQVGEISSVSEGSFVLKTQKGEKKVLLTGEEKIFRITRGKRATISASNLKTGERAAVVGSTDAEGEFVAKVVLVKSLPQNINGVIEKVDEENFTISVKNSQKGITYLADVETTTKIQTWEKGVGFKKLGFSKLQIGNRIHVNGSSTEEENRLSAVRILVLPGEAVGITGTSPTPSPAVNPSLTPEASPTVSAASPTPQL